MVIRNSPDITVLEIAVVWDISGTTPVIILENQSQGDNLGNVDYWWDIYSPTNTAIHIGDENDPDKTGVWSEDTLGYAWPRPFNQIEWGVYTFRVYAKDSEGNIFTHPVQSVNICRPTGNLKSSKTTFGLGTVTIEVLCQQARVYFQDVTNTSYQGLTGTIGSSVLRVNYPMDNTGVVPDPFVGTHFATAMVPITYSGKGYQFLYTSIYQYEFEDNCFVRIKYLLNDTFAVWCNVDLLPLVCEFEKLSQSISEGTCTDMQDAQNKMNIIAPKMWRVWIGMSQPLTGVDVPALIEEIKEIGGFDCDCCSAATGIVPTGSSAFDGYTFQIVSEGGDIQGTVGGSGYNIQFLLSDVKYIVKVCDGSPSQTTAFEFVPSVSGDGYTKTYCLSVDVVQFGYDLATAIGENPDLLSFWQQLFANIDGNFNLIVDGGCIFSSSSTCDYEFTLSNIPSSTTYAILTSIKIGNNNIPITYSFNLTNLAGLQTYLNSLGYGTFIVTNPSGQTVLITSSNNGNDIQQLTYKISSTTYIADLDKTCDGFIPISANQVVQNIINYLCDLDDSQVVISSAYEICYINPTTGLQATSTVASGEALTTFITELLSRGCQTIEYIISLGAVNCVRIKQQFPENPTVAMQPNDIFLVTKAGGCSQITPNEAFLTLLTYGINNSDVLAAFCNMVIECNGGLPCAPYNVFYVTVDAGSPAGSEIELVVTFDHPDAISNTIRYARIDNTQTPVCTTIPGVLPGDSPYTISTSPALENGQYRVYIRPIYADGRLCAETYYDTPACTGINSFSAIYDGTNIVINYNCNSSVPSVKVNISYPNGGSFSQIYDNTGVPITITPPTGVYGTFFATIQPVCDSDTGFFGTASAPSAFIINPSDNSSVQNVTADTFDVTVNFNSTEVVPETSLSSASSTGFYIANGTYSNIAVIVNPASVDYVVTLVTGTGTYTAVYDGVSTYNFNNISIFNGATINITNGSSPSSNNFLVTNNHGGYINSVTPPVFVISDGAFPIGVDEAAEGLHAGFSSALVVNITAPDSSGSVRLLKNSVLQECINVSTGTADYTFGAVTFASGDDCEVIYVSGVCT